jgi:hypothetical protein
MARIQLRDLCGARSGDKGDISDVTLFADDAAAFDAICEQVTVERVREHFSGLVDGPVERFEASNVLALKFVLHRALGGGAPRSLRSDNLGKTHAANLLRLWIDVPDEVARSARRRPAPPAGWAGTQDEPAPLPRPEPTVSRAAPIAAAPIAVVPDGGSDRELDLAPRPDPETPPHGEHLHRGTVPAAAPSKARPFIVLLVFLGAFLACLTFQRGHIASLDGRFMVKVAKQVMENNTIRGPYSEFGIGVEYSTYAPGMSVLAAPALLLEGDWNNEEAFFVTGINPILVAAAAAVFVALARRLRIPPRQAVMGAAVMAVGSPMLQYSTEFFSEPAIAVLSLLAVLALMRNREGGSFSAWALGLVLAVAILFRADSVVTLAAPCVLAFPFFRREKLFRGLVALAVPGAVAVGLTLWHNYARYKDPFDSGYQEGFKTPVLDGLYGLVLSPGKGALFFFPAFLIGLVGLFVLGRRDRAVTAVIAALVVVRTVFFAAWTQWEGGVGWGPRFLVPSFVLLCLPMAAAFEALRGRGTLKAAGRVLAATLVALSAGLSLLSVLVPYEEVWDGDPGHIRNTPPGFSGESQTRAIRAQVNKAKYELDDGVIELTIRELIEGGYREPNLWFRDGRGALGATFALGSAGLWALALLGSGSAAKRPQRVDDDGEGPPERVDVGRVAVPTG